MSTRSPEEAYGALQRLARAEERTTQQAFELYVHERFLAGTIVGVTAAYLFLDARRLPLSERIRHFMSDRRANQPAATDVNALEEHRLDTIECFEQRFGTVLGGRVIGCASGHARRRRS